MEILTLVKNIGAFRGH